MSITVFLLFLLILVIPYVLLIRFLKSKSRVIALIVLSMFWVGLLAMSAVYALDYPFRKAVDARFNTTTTHVDYVTHGRLPLPPHTTLNNRDSESSVTYFTIQSEEEAMQFFKDEADNQSFQQPAAHQIVLKKDEQLYKITFEKSTNPNGVYLDINYK